MLTVSEASVLCAVYLLQKSLLIHNTIQSNTHTNSQTFRISLNSQHSFFSTNRGNVEFNQRFVRLETTRKI